MPIPAALMIAAGLGAASSVVTNVWNAREAKKNREFQERMSSTAHQREVLDLRKAGINPMLSARGSGASTPGGDRAQMEDVGRGASSAVMARAQLKLTEAQTDREKMSAMLLQQQRFDLEGGQGAGRQAKAVADLRELDARQLRDLIPSALAKAREEVRLTANSADAARARAVLDEAAAARAGNLEQFEKRMGEMGPAVRFFFEILRGIRQ